MENAVKTAKHLMLSNHRVILIFLYLTGATPLVRAWAPHQPNNSLTAEQEHYFLPPSLLVPAVPYNIVPKLQQQKAKQSYYFNSHSKELPEIHPRDQVKIKPPKPTEENNPLMKATVETKVDIHSYHVRTEDG